MIGPQIEYVPMRKQRLIRGLQENGNSAVISNVSV
jgi:hypothetical protein